MEIMLPLLVIVVGVAVLVFGRRLSVLGAAVGALLGVTILRLIPGGTEGNALIALLVPILLAVIGFFVAGFAKGIIDIVLLVIGALAGAGIVLAFLELFSIDLGWINWLFALVGGVVGLIMVRRFKEWAMIVLAGLIGGLLVTRGLAAWFPILQDFLGTVLVIVLAGVGIAYQGGFFAKRKAAKKSTPAKPTPPPASK